MSKPYTAVKKTNWVLYAVIAAVLLIAAAVILSLGLSSSAAPGGPYRIKVTSRGGITNSYTALPEAGEVFDQPDLHVERWKWVIRGDGTCNGSIFTNDGDGQGNLSDVVYYSNVFDPTDHPTDDQMFEQINNYHDQYICFSALLSDGSWVNGLGTQLDLIRASTIVVLPENWDTLTTAEKIALNPYECIDTTQIDSESGHCLSGGSTLPSESLDDIEEDPIVDSITHFDPDPETTDYLPFVPQNADQMTGYTEGYLRGSTNDLAYDQFWRNLYGSFEGWVSQSNPEPLACYTIRADFADFIVAARAGNIPADVPAELHAYINERARYSFRERAMYSAEVGIATTAEGLAFIKLKHQAIYSESLPTGICVYDILPSSYDQLFAGAGN